MAIDKPEILIPVGDMKAHPISTVSQEVLARAERILLDQPDYRVVSFSLTIIVCGRALKFDREGERLTEDIREMIGKLASGKVIYLENIFARTDGGEEIVIPWCILRVA